MVKQILCRIEIWIEGKEKTTKSYLSGPWLDSYIEIIPKLVEQAKKIHIEEEELEKEK